MARSSMGNLLTRMRRLIGDPSGTSAVWIDDELQQSLDVYQVAHLYERLQPAATIQPGGKRIYLDFYSVAGLGDWEENEILTDASFNVLTPATSDRITGHWTFATSVGLVAWISGQTYDLYGSAADICEDWAAKVKLEFDVRTMQRQYSRMQQYTALMGMAARLRQKALPGFARMIRTDVNPIGSLLPSGFLGDPGNDLGRGRVR